jgi:oligopeptide/dipeptide ABC transporter, ATP-binding protein, C-terminal domain
LAQETLLEIRDLHVHFETREGTVRALRGVDLVIKRGETLGLVGESGCGKSMTARAILNMVPRPGRIVSGSIRFFRQGNLGPDTAPVEITKLDPYGPEMRAIRGKEIAMIFQEPMASLSPVHTVGNQIMEAIMIHQGLSKSAARERAAEMLDLVGIPNPRQRLDAYPFELSGGMRQRAMIAMALSCDPDLLIADEPTTALDVTIQAQILELLQRLQEQMGMAILMITHNLGVVAAVAHRVAVMYLGKVVEVGETIDIFDTPAHPYTRALLRSVPRAGEKRRRLWAIEGSVPGPHTQVPGCAFHPRCPEAIPGVCDQREPEVLRFGQSQWVRCVLHEKGASDKAASGKGAY